MRFVPFALVILLAAALLRTHQLETYPPGPHYDEAANLLIARSIAFGDSGLDLFPIANSYQGRESLYHYLSAPLLLYVADDIFSMQILSVFLNLITIAAAMALGRAMFPGRRGMVVGVAIGVLMAISFHQLLMSRQAYRAVTLPMTQALALLFVWRGLNLRGRRSWLLLAVGGVFAAAALYTYMASRLFPVWLLIGGLALMLFDRQNWRWRLRQGGVFFAALLIAALPMLIYAVQYPEIFWQRLDEVTGSSGEVVTLAESIRGHLEMFFIYGEDGNLRYNIPGRPYFTPLEGALLLVGICVALWRVLRPNRAAVKPTERAAYVMALLAPLMVIPSVVAVGGLPPSNMRSLGMVPLIFVLVAVGFEVVFVRLLRLFDPPQMRPALVAIAASALIVGGGWVWNSYQGWADEADLFYQADGDLAAVVDWLPGQVDSETLVYVSSFHREHPTVITGWERSVTWLGTDSLFLPPPGRNGVAIFSHNTPPPEIWQDWLAPRSLEGIPPGPDGEPAFYAFRLSAEADLLGMTGTARNHLVSLVDTQSVAGAAGSTAEITTMWEVQQPPPFYRLRPILDLRTPDGVTLASTDVFLLGTDGWLPGEMMVQRMSLPVPVGTPPGEYPLYITWVDRDTETYLSYVTPDGTQGGISEQVGHLTVQRPETFPPADVLAIENRFAQPIQMRQGAELLGTNPPDEVVRPGERINAALFWRAIAVEDRPEMPLRTVLQGPDGAETLIWRGELMHPPQNWQPDELITEHLSWTIPRDQPTGEYTLLLRSTEGQAAVGDIRVEGMPRRFEAPPVEHTVYATYGDALVLHGYDLDTSGDAISLRVVWQAERTVTEDYTVFVHLIGPDGEIIRQIDRMPVENRYPTSLWLTGEYIEDVYTFDQVPTGEYRLRIGFYLPATGQRLPLNIGDNYEISPIAKS